MKRYLLFYSAFIIVLFSTYSFAQTGLDENNLQYLNWDKKTAVSTGELWLIKGRVGGFFDSRILDTDKSFNYKLRATLMSPEAIRASARLEQIRNRLTNDETKKMIADAEQENLVVLVEIDPREGSGIIPNDWRAYIQAKNSSLNESIPGNVRNDLRNFKAFQPVNKRDYDYDLFWVSFSLTDKNGVPLWKTVPNELELVVAINGKEGKVKWKVTNDLKLRIENLLKLEPTK